MPKSRNPNAALDGLIANIERAAPLAGRTTLSVDLLVPSPYQPRRQFDDARLASLAASLREHGLLQPIVVRPVQGHYEVVAGERRLRAARLAGLMTVPVEVRDVTDTEARLLAAAENLQREDLSVIDEVDATLTLAAEALGLPLGEARRRLGALVNRPEQDMETVGRLEALFAQLGRGTWQSFVKNKLRVLSWPEAVLTAMRQDGVRYRVAGIVAAAPTEHQAELLVLARSGATHEEVRARASALSSREDETGIVARRALRLAGSAREVARLDPTRRAELERLLARIDALFEEDGDARSVRVPRSEL